MLSRVGLRAACALRTPRAAAAARAATRCGAVQPLCCARAVEAAAEADESAARRSPTGLAGPPSAGGELIDTQPVRGTRDFLPDELRLRNWLFGHFREVTAAAAAAGREHWRELARVRCSRSRRPRSLCCTASRSGTRLWLKVSSCTRARAARRSPGRRGPPRALRTARRGEVRALSGSHARPLCSCITFWTRVAAGYRYGRS